MFEKANADYLALLEESGLAPNAPATLTCPSCGVEFWMTLPPDLLVHDETVLIACPASCGAGCDLRQFSPVPSMSADRERYDTRVACPRHPAGYEFAANGVLLRCPCCFIENSREIMVTVVETIRNRITGEQDCIDRASLEAMLARVVSTFDGVMRSMVAIARRNCLQLGKEWEINVSSFQNLHRADWHFSKSYWSLSRATPDFPILVRAFQKRHLISHTLGVVDQEYIDKTGDPDAVVGRLIRLTGHEVLTAAEIASVIARSFFAHFLS